MEEEGRAIDWRGFDIDQLREIANGLSWAEDEAGIANWDVHRALDESLDAEFKKRGARRLPDRLAFDALDD